MKTNLYLISYGVSNKIDSIASYHKWIYDNWLKQNTKYYFLLILNKAVPAVQITAK